SRTMPGSMPPPIATIGRPWRSSRIMPRHSASSPASKWCRRPNNMRGDRGGLTVALLGAALLLMPLRAHALVMVVGDGLAHDCFLIAKAGKDPQKGIATCNEALTEEALDPGQRAGTYI